jgi:hypothetical protein
MRESTLADRRNHDPDTGTYPAWMRAAPGVAAGAVLASLGIAYPMDQSMVAVGLLAVASAYVFVALAVDFFDRSGDDQLNEEGSDDA